MIWKHNKRWKMSGLSFYSFQLVLIRLTQVVREDTHIFHNYESVFVGNITTHHSSLLKNKGNWELGFFPLDLIKVVPLYNHQLGIFIRVSFFSYIGFVFQIFWYFSCGVGWWWTCKLLFWCSQFVVGFGFLCYSSSFWVCLR